MDEATLQRLGSIIAERLAVHRQSLLGPAAVAERLGVTTRQLRRLVARKILPPGVRLGKQTIRWTWQEVEAAVAELRQRKTRRRRPAGSRAED